MRITKTSVAKNTGATPLNVKEVGYNTVGMRSRQTLNAADAALFIGGSAATNLHMALLRNSSINGAIIRFGDDQVSFGAPPFGIPLYPGDSVEVDLFAFPLYVKTNLDGALLDVLDVATAV